MSTKIYPDEAVVFEVMHVDPDDSDDIRVGDHVEGAGPCCIGTQNEGKCGVLMINNVHEYSADAYQWVRSLRPLTPAAHDMVASLNPRWP